MSTDLLSVPYVTAMASMLLTIVGFGLWIAGMVNRSVGVWATLAVSAIGLASAAVVFLLRFQTGWPILAMVAGAVLAGGVGAVSRRARRSPQGSMPAAS